MNGYIVLKKTKTTDLSKNDHVIGRLSELFSHQSDQLFISATEMTCFVCVQTHVVFGQTRQDSVQFGQRPQQGLGTRLGFDSRVGQFDETVDHKAKSST